MNFCHFVGPVCHETSLRIKKPISCSFIAETDKFPEPLMFKTGMRVTLAATVTLSQLQMLDDTLTVSAASFNQSSSKQFDEDLEETIVRLKVILDDIKKNPNRYFKISVF